MRRLVYAHRGGAALAPENTIAAFDNAVRLGADGLEFDVRLSRDGVPVVHHDPTLDRTTNGTGAVAAYTADELACVDAGYRFARDDAFPFRGQGVGVPRLDAVLQRYPDTPVIIELKDDTAALAHAVVDTIDRADAYDRAVVASFRTRALLAARRASRDLRTGPTPGEVRAALLRSWIGLAPRNVPYVGFQVPECWGRLRVVSPRFVHMAARGALPVFVWVVNTHADMQRLFEWGVAGVITDRPDMGVFLTGSSRL